MGRALGHVRALVARLDHRPRAELADHAAGRSELLSEQAGNGDRMQFEVVGFDQAEAWLSTGSARRVPVVVSRSG